MMKNAQNLTVSEIRKRFIDFFTNHDHVQVPSSSLVPEKHPSLLFTNSGMVQFTPYFLGEKDPIKDFGNKKLLSVQKSVRTGDLDIVGKSPYHHTFFEMLGSWSIGDYFKDKAVELAYDLITNKDYGYGIDSSKLIATVFEGNEECPVDQETINAWKRMGLKDNQISKLPASENWWAPAGLTGPGPCGPCTEVLIDRGEAFGPKEEIPGMTDNPRYLEFWNAGVFMQFNRVSNGGLHVLPAKSVDTGAGLERFATMLQGKESNYEIDLFVPIIEKIKSFNQMVDFEKPEIKESLRRSADHIRAAVFMIADGVYPSNKDQGYVLRRIIRRVVNDYNYRLVIKPGLISNVVPVIREVYDGFYPEINSPIIEEVLIEEVNTYKKASETARVFITRDYVRKGISVIKDPFKVYETTGASLELIEELARDLNLTVDSTTFEEDLKTHQNESREKGAGKFKGGLTGDSAMQTRLHTATHLLHGALREVLGSQLHQMGSNITNERLRFDFNHDVKLTQDQLNLIESIVNEKIKAAIAVNRIEMPKTEAEKSGALHFFGDKYGDSVNIYYIGTDLSTAWSKEFCGGPHVFNTSDVGEFKIIKEESVAKGVRRIKAIVK